jgi:hypothetical protein
MRSMRELSERMRWIIALEMLEVIVEGKGG